jgi:transposase
MEHAEARRKELEEQIAILLPSWSLAPVVNAMLALRGVAPIIAVSIVAEIGDFARFASPRQLMAYLGLIPGEHSSGSTIRTRGITKQGNSVLRALLFEAAWAYRFAPKVSPAMLAGGKKSQVAITAVARELLGFVWAIARSVAEPAVPTAAAQA